MLNRCICIFIFYNVLMLTLTALVESVEPGFVIATHLLGIAKGHVGVGDGDHGGLVVLGEGVPARAHGAVRLEHSTSWETYCQCHFGIRLHIHPTHE